MILEVRNTILSRGNTILSQKPITLRYYCLQLTKNQVIVLYKKQMVILYLNIQNKIPLSRLHAARGMFFYSNESESLGFYFTNCRGYFTLE